MAKLLKPGTVIYVTDASGRKTSGRLGQLSAWSLELLGTRSEIHTLTPTPIPVSRRFSDADVRAIEVRRNDSVMNGTLIGMAVGGIAGAVVGAANCGQSSCQAGPVAVAFGGLFAGIGAGAGLLIDVLIDPRIRVYTSGQHQTNVRVSPMLSKAGPGPSRDHHPVTLSRLSDDAADQARRAPSRRPLA